MRPRRRHGVGAAGALDRAQTFRPTVWIDADLAKEQPTGYDVARQSRAVLGSSALLVVHTASGWMKPFDLEELDELPNEAR